MQLNVRSWGSGARTAVLVHGFSDDADTWWRVAPAIADLGFTVLAPELRGHGRSPRAERYPIEGFAADLVESVPAEADLVLGHSLGAVVLGLAAPRLRPRLAVFVDPAWLRPPVPFQAPAARPEQLPPGWSPEDVAVDLASNACLDPAVAPALVAQLAEMAPLPVPPAVHPGAVVLVPELEPLLPIAAHPVVEEAGYRIVTQAAVGHVMHRDDPAGFLDLLRPELVEGGVAA